MIPDRAQISKPPFISYTQIDWGGLNAAAVIVTLPVLIMILFVQKHMVRGLTLGSTKG
jgi:multiple sugar transport system permease protein